MAYACIICGADLGEVSATAACAFCGEVTPADYVCPQGHHVCDGCQAATPVEIIERVCTTTRSTDPGAIAALIMKHPAFVMHGPHHHALVAPAVLAALVNLGHVAPGEGIVAGALRRTVDVPAAVCASRGACGAAQSAGALVSILTGATYLKDRERSLALRTTAAALLAIAEGGGPRCCKQSIYLALETAVDVARRELGVEIPLSLRCEFVAANPECKRARCAYFPDPDGVA